MISASKAGKSIRIHPAVGLTTLCFSKNECEILTNHIAMEFGIEFYLNSHPDGKVWTIKISALEQIKKFFNLIMPFCEEIPCLRYKYDLPYRLERKREELIQLYNEEYEIRISSIDNIPNYYSEEDEKAICAMKRAGKIIKKSLLLS